MLTIINLHVCTLHTILCICVCVCVCVHACVCVCVCVCVCITCSPLCTLLSEVSIKPELTHGKAGYFPAAVALQIAERNKYSIQLHVICYFHSNAVLREE